MSLNLYQVLEQHLRQSSQPLTCVDLHEKADVRKLADDVNEVSNALGYMWRNDRRGAVTRVPAPKVYLNQSKWAYQWRDPEPVEEEVQVSPKARRIIVSRPTLEISEDDGIITIELPELEVVIKPRR